MFLKHLPNVTQQQKKKLWNFMSHYETLKRKINAVKTIEDKIIDISNDEKLIEDIIIENNEFESNLTWKILDEKKTYQWD